MGRSCGGKQLEVSVDGRIIGALGFSGFDPRLWVRTQPSIPRQVPAVQMKILKLGRVRMEADLQSEQIITNGIDNSYLGPLLPVKRQSYPQGCICVTTLLTCLTDRLVLPAESSQRRPSGSHRGSAL